MHGGGHERQLLHKNIQGQWKFKIMTNQRTEGLTWVGAGDTYASKNENIKFIFIICVVFCHLRRGSEFVRVTSCLGYRRLYTRLSPGISSAHQFRRSLTDSLYFRSVCPLTTSMQLEQVVHRAQQTLFSAFFLPRIPCPPCRPRFQLTP